MADYIFDIVIIVLFLYEGIMMITKKNAGSSRNVDKYTEESLAKFSKIAGVIFLIFAAYEGFILLNKLNVISVLDSLGDDSLARILITTAPVFVVLIVILILHFTILKKKDGYSDSSNGPSNRGNDEEDY